MLHHLPGTARKARKSDAENARDCFRCIHFGAYGLDEEGCKLFVSAVRGKLGDVAVLRGEAGDCKPSALFFEPFEADVVSTKACKACRHADYHSGVYRCWLFAEGTSPGLCATLRNRGGACGPDANGFEVSDTFAMGNSLHRR